MEPKCETSTIAPKRDRSEDQNVPIASKKFKGDIKQHPEILNGTYEILATERRPSGKQTHAWIHVRNSLGDAWIRDNGFKQGYRPPACKTGTLATYVETDAPGWMLEDEMDGKLSRGSRERVNLIFEGEVYEVNVNNFCNGHRPHAAKSGTLMTYLEESADGWSLADEMDGKLSRGSNKKVNLIFESEVYEVAVYSFCAGQRPPASRSGMLKTYLEESAPGWMLEDEIDGKLSCGSHEKVNLIYEGEVYEMYVFRFCAGHRPLAANSGTLMTYLEESADGWSLMTYLEESADGWSLADEMDGKLSRGSNKKVNLIFKSEVYEVAVYSFCTGRRPPAAKSGKIKTLVQFTSGAFIFKTEDDGELPMHSTKEITIVFTKTGVEYTYEPQLISKGLCVGCCLTHSSSYSAIECANCWSINHPTAALAGDARNKNKSEIHCGVMLKAHADVFGEFVREHPILGNKRLDFVLLKTNTVIEPDGMQHFSVVPEWPNSDPDKICETDIAKTVEHFRIHPDSAVVRVFQPAMMPGYPVNTKKPITFDYISAINYIENTPAHNGVVTFIEPAGNTLYDKHKADYTAKGIAYISIDPNTFDFGNHKLPDKRYAFSN